MTNATRGSAIGTGRTDHGDLARNGVPKRQTPPTPYPHQHVATTNDGGKLIAHGVSKTEAAKLLNTKTIQGGNTPVFDGGQPKAHVVGGNVPIHSGMNADAKHDAEFEDVSKDVLAEAAISGSHIAAGAHTEVARAKK